MYLAFTSDRTVEERLAVHEYERVHCAPSDHVSCEDRLAGSGRRDQDALVARKQGTRSLLLSRGEGAQEPGVEWHANASLVTHRDGDSVSRREVLQRAQASSWEDKMAIGLLGTGHDSWDSGCREPHSLSLVEDGIPEGREPADLGEQGRGELCSLDEETLCQHDGDPFRKRPWDGRAHERAGGPCSPGGIFVFSGKRDAEHTPAPERLPSDELHGSRWDSLDAGEELPLVLEGLERVIHEDRVPVLPRPPLER